jgi:predicted nucleotidyltransferase component of viral defense system
VRGTLDTWLGEPTRQLKAGCVTLVYRMVSAGPPVLPMRLKVEINSREHFSVHQLEDRPYEVESRWFSGRASIHTYQLDELLGTKLRALYQRRKGRDLFDLWFAGREASVTPDRVVRCFLAYLEHEGLRVSHDEFEANLREKLDRPGFLGDIAPLLAPGCDWDVDEAVRYVRDQLLTRLPGGPGASADPVNEAPR